jgi:hypothetical protein
MHKSIRSMLIWMALSLATMSPAKASLIGTDVDVLITVGGNTVMNQSVTISAPSTFVSSNFGGVDYGIVFPNFGSDDSSFTFVPFKFSDSVVSDVELTISSIAGGGPVTGLTQVSGFGGGVTSFTDSSVTVSWSSLFVGLPTYHFDIEIQETVTAPEPVPALLLGGGLLALALRKRRRI